MITRTDIEAMNFNDPKVRFSIAEELLTKVTTIIARMSDTIGLTPKMSPDLRIQAYSICNETVCSTRDTMRGLFLNEPHTISKSRNTIDTAITIEVLACYSDIIDAVAITIAKDYINDSELRTRLDNMMDTVTNANGILINYFASLNSLMVD